MFSRPTNLKSGQWGDTWLLVKPASGSGAGRLYLFETVGAAVMTQLQALVLDGTLPTDRSYGNVPIGDNRTRVDGIWGMLTMGGLWVYVKRAYELGLLGRTRTLAQWLEPMQWAMDNRTLPEELFVMAARLLYFTKRVVRRPGQAEQVLPARFADLVGDGLGVVVGTTFESGLGGLPRYGEFVAYGGDLDVVNAQPTYRVVTTGLPPVPADAFPGAAALVVQGPTPPAPTTTGPWTLGPGERPPVWNSTVPAPTGGTAPGVSTNPEPLTPSDGGGKPADATGGPGGGTGTGAPTVEPPKPGYIPIAPVGTTPGVLAGSVAAVGRAVLPYAAGIAVAVGLGVTLYALWPKRPAPAQLGAPGAVPGYGG